jgi:hypothetical protein
MNQFIWVGTIHSVVQIIDRHGDVKKVPNLTICILQGFPFIVLFTTGYFIWQISHTRVGNFIGTLCICVQMGHGWVSIFNLTKHFFKPRSFGTYFNQLTKFLRISKCCDKLRAFIGFGTL